MSRFSKWQKEAIIRAILNDTPNLDYSAQIEALARQGFMSLVPQPIQDILNGTDEEAKKWIQSKWCRVPGSNGRNPSDGSASMYAYGGGYGFDKLPADIKEQINALYEKAVAQHKLRTALEDRLERAFTGIRTRAQAMKLLPEFERYYPKVEEQCRTLPVVTDVISSLMEAGWPKEQEKAA